MNQSALTTFFRILGISTVWLTIFLSNVKFRVVEKDTLYTNLLSFQRQVKSKHCCFFEQHMKYFNTQQVGADETDLLGLVNNADIQEVDDLQQDDFPEAPREGLQEVNNGLDIDESSVNHFGLIANLLLELREKYSLVQLEYISNLLSVKTRAYCRARSKYVCQ